MDIYHIWFDLKPGVTDAQMVEAANAFLNRLQEEKLIRRWRLLRRKLGLSPLQDFHIMIETRHLGHLEKLFQRVASRVEPVDGEHVALNSLIDNPTFALERDFPDQFDA